MKTFLLIGMLFVASSLSAQAPSGGAVNWLTFEALSDSLAKAPKPVLLFIHTDWCSYCRKMMQEGFEDPQVIEKINQAYYAVQLDAESADSIRFDGFVYTNPAKRKKTGKYHSLATILIGKNKNPVFPATMLLDEGFNFRERHFKYLNKKELLNIL